MNRSQPETSGDLRAVVAATTRRLFLRRTTAIAVAGASATWLAGSAVAETPEQREARMEKVGPDRRRKQRDEFESIQKHEADHVDALVAALGVAARPKPTFQNLEQKNFQDFVRLARTLENVGVGAYLGAAPYIDDIDILATAGSIATIEARHAGYLNALLGDPITGNAVDDDANPSFEAPLTADDVVTAAGAFIADLNGGPAIDYDTVLTPQNDIAIVNFALALEYLERDFYAINVPKFYKVRN